MKLDIYVNYRGVCEQAFRFYAQHLGGKITSMMAFKQLPDPTNVPECRENDILHATIEIGDMVLRGSRHPQR